MTTGSVEQVLELQLPAASQGQVLLLLQIERSIRAGHEWVAAYSQDGRVAASQHATTRVPFGLGITLKPGVYESATLLWVQYLDMAEAVGEWHINYIRVDKQGRANAIGAQEYNDAIYPPVLCPGGKLGCTEGTAGEPAPAPASYAVAEPLPVGGQP